MNPALRSQRQCLAVQRLHFNFQQVCTVRPYFRQWTPPAFSATLPQWNRRFVRKGPVRSRDYAVHGLGDRQVTHAWLHARAATNGLMSRISLKRAITNNTPFSRAARHQKARCLHHGSPPVHAAMADSQNRCHLFHLLRQNNQNGRVRYALNPSHS